MLGHTIPNIVTILSSSLWMDGWRAAAAQCKHDRRSGEYVPGYKTKINPSKCYILYGNDEMLIPIKTELLLFARNNRTQLEEEKKKGDLFLLLPKPPTDLPISGNGSPITGLTEEYPAKCFSSSHSFRVTFRQRIQFSYCMAHVG